MAFLNSNMLWGMLAVALPVIIHFWYQKKGKQIAWAASQWLAENTSMQHRGIRLEEIPLLLLRCLLVILLALLLSEPKTNWFADHKKIKQIHLVQADLNVVNNFRFEIENALQKKEQIIWITSDLQPLKNIGAVPASKSGLPYLQRHINQIANSRTHANIYLINNQQINDLPTIQIPGTYKLHAMNDSAVRKDNPLVGLERKTRKKAIRILVDYRNRDEMQTVRAALDALAEVYKIPFQVDKQTAGNVKYDWILTDKPVAKPDASALYVVSESNTGQEIFDNVFTVSDSLRLTTSEMVQNGQLPEWLGDLLIKHYALESNRNRLSDQQLHAHFEALNTEKGQDSYALRKWLSLAFVITLLLERWISLHQKGNPRYA